ncbi:MAG: site-specific integrase [Oscillospiraceae bacterium]|nr:site-specific integrase [Oscillospiraceae bacterium]
MARKKYIKRTISLPDGTRKWVYGKTKKEVEDKLTELRLQMRSGVDLKNHDTFVEFTQIWVDTFKKGKTSEANLERIKRNLNNHVIPYLGTYRMKDISPIQCQDVLNHLREQNKSRDLEQKVYDLMKNIFTVAVENGLIYKSPITSTVGPTIEKPKEKDPLTPEQVKTLTRKIKGQDIEPFVLVALYTGMRKGEVLGLQWHDVDIIGGELMVRNALKWPGNNAGVISPILKSEAAYRKIPFGGELRAVFLQLWAQRDGPCVFHRDGKPLSHGAFRVMWKKAASALPAAEDFTPHILRHTCITNWIFAGYDVKTVQYLAGHADAKTTLNHYAKYLEAAQYEQTKKQVQEAQKKKKRKSQTNHARVQPVHLLN